MLPFWKRRPVAFLFFLSGMGAFLLAMSVSIEAVHVEREVTGLEDRVAKERAREKGLEDAMIFLSAESRLRAYAKAHHLTRALPADVIYLH